MQTFIPASFYPLCIKDGPYELKGGLQHMFEAALAHEML